VSVARPALALTPLAASSRRIWASEVGWGREPLADPTLMAATPPAVALATSGAPAPPPPFEADPPPLAPAVPATGSTACGCAEGAEVTKNAAWRGAEWV